MTNTNSTIVNALNIHRARRAAVETIANSKPVISKEDTTRAREATKAEREARKAEIEQIRATRKAEKEVKKAAKEAEKAARIPNTARLKVAAAKLPVLTETADTALNNLDPDSLNETELSAVIAHLQHALRSRQTLNAIQVASEVAVGDRVIVIAGEARFIGLVGTVTKTGRIRCHVEIDGRESPLYVFVSDIRKITDEATEISETEESPVGESEDLTGTDN